MTATVYQYKVWCDTDSKWVYVWDTEVPTTCPENNGHTIDTAKTIINDEVSEELPVSPDTNKLAVQSSAKPMINGQDTYAVWAGAGDDSTTGITGDGDLLDFDMTPGTATVTKDVSFHPDNGQVWINEAYIRYDGAGAGDYIGGTIMAPATALQQAVSLDLELDVDWVKYAAGGAGTGTHGFAGTPVLVPRNFSMDGHWDFDGTNLLPNMSAEGAYHISTIERIVHKFVTKIPCRGTTNTYFNLASDDTSELLQPYFIRITANNVSDTTWNAQVFLEIYRARTVKP